MAECISAAQTSSSVHIATILSSLADQSKKGLEVSVLGIVATGSRRAFGVDATQTPPDLPADRAGGYSRVAFYLEQIIDLYDQLAGLGVFYWVGDGFCAKQKVFDTAGTLEEISLPVSARTRTCGTFKRQLPTGPPKEGLGAPKQYDGKIDWNDQEALIRRFDEVGRLPDQPQVRIPTTVADSPHFGRDLRVALLIGPDGEEQAVLASANTNQHAEEIARYYRLRYQIGLAIRDDSRHVGPAHCQARSQEKLDFHLNMSHGSKRASAHKAECSPRSHRWEAYNRLPIGRLFLNSASAPSTTERIHASNRLSVPDAWSSGGYSQLLNLHGLLNLRNLQLPVAA